MRRSRLAVQVVLLVVCTVFFTSLAHGQFRASLRGTVTDPQGAVIPGAKVTLVNVDTNSTLVSTSDDNGIYNFNGLAPAPYRIIVEREGFKSACSSRCGSSPSNSIHWICNWNSARSIRL